MDCEYYHQNCLCSSANVYPSRMIALAVIALTIFQPGFFFAPMMRKSKGAKAGYGSV